jgi:hypothetical protein
VNPGPAVRTESPARPRGRRRAAAGALFGLLGAVLGAAYLARLGQLPIHSDRDAFLAVLLMGWLGCTVGMRAVVGRSGWARPDIAIGAALGVAALAVVGFTLMGWGGPLTSISSLTGLSLDGMGVLLLAVILAVKSALALGLSAPLLPRRAETSNLS